MEVTTVLDTALDIDVTNVLPEVEASGMIFRNALVVDIVPQSAESFEELERPSVFGR